ncbi:MAG: methyltransferase domain-containing protein [Planctomycetes bacterium]|nr:methyltransferase domain-containing protein [Planctomycetota bacterium]
MKDPWSAVAPGYLEHWVPRFRPFLLEAVDALAARPLGPGPLAVPGCGPGEEVLALRRRLPDREVVAMDPSRPMLELLRARVAGDPRVRVVEGAAEDLPAHVAGAGALSCFTLQLLERPLDALTAWARALAPGAPLVVLFWPRQPPDSAWGRLRPAIEAEAGAWRDDWEPGTRAGLGGRGLALIDDRPVRAPMRHPSPEAAWDRLVDAGSLQGLARRVAPDVLARCRARWLADHRLTLDPAGAGAGDDHGSWVHTPEARLWVLRSEGSG